MGVTFTYLQVTMTDEDVSSSSAISYMASDPTETINLELIAEVLGMVVVIDWALVAGCPSGLQAFSRSGYLAPPSPHLIQCT